jgi:hypothetical protein
MTYSSLATRFVAAPDNWPRNGAPIRGIFIHHAEGGGTVSWLTRNDGNSSHYVVEYDGDIVAMVHEERAAGSMNPKLTRTSDDAPYTYLGSTCRYGRTALNRVMGAFATNPNAAAIAIEVEGFAAVGPNARQRASLARLVLDIRKRHGPLACLGHRDQQSYKACPGHHIPWVDYGGHGVRSEAVTIGGMEDKGVAVKGSKVPEVPTQVTLRTDPKDASKSRFLYVYSDHRADPGNTQLKPNRPLLLTRFIDADTYAVAYEPAAGDTNSTSIEMFVHSEDVKATAPVAPVVDQTKVDALTAELADARAQASNCATKAAAAVEEAKTAEHALVDFIAKFGG